MRINAAKRQAQQRSEALDQKYRELTESLVRVDNEKKALLEGADLPLPGLSVEGGKLLYKGRQWDCMSGSEQLIVGTAIARALNPHCGFVLLDKLEQMDMVTLDAFGVWLKQHGLQAIATRVSTGNECTVIIEDGGLQETDQKALPLGEGSSSHFVAAERVLPTTLKAGEF